MPADISSQFVTTYLKRLNRKVFTDFHIQYTLTGDAILTLKGDEAVIFYRELFFYYLTRINSTQFTNLAFLETLQDEFNATKELVYINLGKETKLLAQPSFVTKLEKVYRSLNLPDRLISALGEYKMSLMSYYFLVFTFFVYEMYVNRLTFARILKSC